MRPSQERRLQLALEMRCADLRLYLAQRRLGRAIDELARKYRPDQPRAPKGTPEGGQWVVDAGTGMPVEPDRFLVADIARRLEALGGGQTRAATKPKRRSAVYLSQWNDIAFRFVARPISWQSNASH